MNRSQVAAINRAAERRELEAEIKRLEDKYYELLYAVQNKHPGETRHQTALRIITNHEIDRLCNNDTMEAAIRTLIRKSV